MSVVGLLIALALPTAAAWWLLRAVDPSGAEAPLGYALHGGLALLLGPSVGSMIAYGWLAAGVGLGSTYAIADALLFAAALAWSLLRWRRRATAIGPVPRLSRVERVVLASALAAAILAGWQFVRLSVAAPHGQWDAWSIWNLHARALFRAVPPWPLLRDPALAFGHPEYPLFLPAAVARIWSYSGESTAAPVALAGLFTVAPFLVLLGGVARRAGPLAGAIACLLLAATAEWTANGATQYADVPLAALFLAAAVASALATPTLPGEAPARGLLAVTGAFLGLSAWTKDEGLVFATLLGIGLLLRHRAQLPRVLGCLVAGAALPLAARLHFHAVVGQGVASLYTGSATTGVLLSSVLDPARWTTILFSSLPRTLSGITWALPLVAVGSAWSLGARARGALGAPWLLAALLGYSALFGAWLITPLDLDWHVRTSAVRVLLQPWPAVLFGLFALSATEDRYTLRAAGG